MMCVDVLALCWLDIWPFRMPCFQRDIVILESELSIIENRNTSGAHTSVKLTGTPFPTMLPTVDAFARISSSCAFASFNFASFCASRSFFFAMSSSPGFSLAFLKDLSVFSDCFPSTQGICCLGSGYAYRPSFSDLCSSELH